MVGAGLAATFAGLAEHQRLQYVTGDDSGFRLAVLILVAVVAYIFMGLSWLDHLIFTFPELLLVVLAVVVLAGRYTGYSASRSWSTQRRSSHAGRNQPIAY